MPNQAEKIWKGASETLRTMLNPEIYNLWFESIKPSTFEADVLTISVANDFCEVWLKDNYLDLIQDVVAYSVGHPVRIQFTVAAADQKNDPNGAELKLPEVKPKAQMVEKPLEKADSLFNPNYRFETFVVAANNQMAHGASMAVAQAPGKSYNPLFLYGGVGLGKTHLLHAVGHYVVRHKKRARVAYVSCEKFTNEFIDGLQNNQLVRFRKKYRLTDVLLIDDIQFLSGKERIQEEFFHTFNALHESHKQIVLTCDRPVCELDGLEQRLVSRFEWGLGADLQPPDVETRVAILRKKAISMNVTLPDEIIDFLATQIRANIRRLEGALIRVASFSSITNQELTLDTVESLLRDTLQDEGRDLVTIDTIQKRVAEHFDIRLADMMSKRRPENIAFPRQVAMFLARQLTDNSLNSIGEAFGGRDHGTVLHACRLVKDRMEIDGNVRQAVRYLEKQLQR